MFNPDLHYTIGTLEHRLRQADVARYHRVEKCIRQRAARRGRLASWLRRLSVRRLHGVTLTR